MINWLSRLFSVSPEVSSTRVALMFSVVGMAVCLFLTCWVVINQLDPSYLSGIGTIALGLAGYAINKGVQSFAERDVK